MKARLDFRTASPEGMKAMGGLHAFIRWSLSDPTQNRPGHIP